MQTRSSSGAAGSGTDGGGIAARAGRRTSGVRSVIAGAAGVLLVIGASTIGLHDWADAQLEAAAAHGTAASSGTATSAGTSTATGTSTSTSST